MDEKRPQPGDVPPGADLRAGEPRHLHGEGRVRLSNGNGGYGGGVRIVRVGEKVFWSCVTEVAREIPCRASVPLGAGCKWECEQGRGGAE